MIILSVDFASYGQPTGQCDGGGFVDQPTCSAGSLVMVRRMMWMPSFPSLAAPHPAPIYFACQRPPHSPRINDDSLSRAPLVVLPGPAAASSAPHRRPPPLPVKQMMPVSFGCPPHPESICFWSQHQYRCCRPQDRGAAAPSINTMLPDIARRCTEHPRCIDL